MEPVLAPPLSTTIIELARRRRKDVYNLIAELISSELDPKARVDVYVAIFKKLLDDAKKLEQQGDTVQASEKYWGAVAALLNAIGEKKGLPHYTHRDYWEIMNTIIDETKDDTLAELFALAEKIHANFYHNFIPKHQFAIYSRRIMTLIDKLKQYAESLGIKVD